jgi:hypothetical protein
MKERQFAGMLNSKSVYGQSYSDYSVLRTFKWTKINNLSMVNPLCFKWYKKYRPPYLAFAPSLWNYGGEISWTQRHMNRFRKNKKIKLFRWR